MIYDCFTFYNELELLELRLHELAGVVDKFVLVEATRTFTNLPKPLNFLKNRSRFEKFQNKIIHIIIEDSPEVSDPWVVEEFQRNGIMRGLAGCRPDDWLLISDVDEIPRAATVKQVVSSHPFPNGLLTNLVLRPAIRLFTAWKFTRGRVRRNNPFILKFQQNNYRHFINCVTVNPPKLVNWHGTRMLFYRDLISPQIARHSGYRIIENGGWHFTSMGGAGRIVEKIKSFAHQEYNRPALLDEENVSNLINQGRTLFDPDEKMKFVPVDGSYPRYILEHPEKFSGWVKPI